MDRAPIVTFSFDDGHGDDMQVAERLAAFGGRATFYVAFNHPLKPQIEPREIRALHSMGHEIGSHTLSHRMLVTLTRAQIDNELRESKARLEDIIGAPVTSLSYPLGYLNRYVLASMAAHGYLVGRTLSRFRYDREFNPYLMPITVEYFPHPRIVLLKQALRDLNFSGFLNWLRAGLVCEPLEQSKFLFPKAYDTKGIFHVTARSWEIEKYHRWDDFDALLKLINGRKGIKFLTNSEATGFLTKH